MSYEEKDTCVSYGEENTCVPYEEEDTCVSYEEDSMQTQQERWLCSHLCGILSDDVRRRDFCAEHLIFFLLQAHPFLLLCLCFYLLAD